MTTSSTGGEDVPAVVPEVVSGAVRAKLPDNEEQYYLDLFRSVVRAEHEIISHRMTWLMTLNGFLTAGFALLLTNASEVQAPRSIALCVVAISLVGTISNGSCFFSNYWGGRAIQEADNVLSEALRATAGRPEESLQPRHYLRLYGRDPSDGWAGAGEGLGSAASGRSSADGTRHGDVPTESSEGRRGGREVNFFRPPSQVLHPWFLLPLAFACVFAAAPHVQPTFANGASGPAARSFAVPIALAWSPVLIAAGIFGLFLSLDWARRARVRRASLTSPARTVAQRSPSAAE